MQDDKNNFKGGFKNRLYKWVLKLLQFIDNLPKDNMSRILSDQLIRSSTSTLANYVEAHSSSSKKDFAHYFRISLRSANESKVWLALLRDTKRGKNELINELIGESQEIAAILASSLITMNKKAGK